jgi:broad specificity phosphatase PhoE
MTGKTHLAYEMKRYIEFFHGARAEVFDVCDYLGPDGDTDLLSAIEHFFQSGEEGFRRSDTKDGQEAGRYHGGFAIVVATDTVRTVHSKWSAHTKWHRRWLFRTLKNQLQANVCFIQVTVQTNHLLEQYVSEFAKKRGKSLQETNQAISDFGDHYVPIMTDGSESDTPYIQLFNYNESMTVNRVMQTFMGSSICKFLSNLHPYEHTIYVSRHGESEYNVKGRIGGDSGLAPRGVEYARRLAVFSEYVVTGKAKSLMCVTLSPEEVKSKLRPLLEKRASLGIHVRGDWTGVGDTSGAELKPGLEVVKLQAGYGNDFQHAPQSVEEIMNLLQRSSEPVTLALVEGDSSAPGKAPGRLWTSSMRRTIETAAFIDHPIISKPDGQAWKQMARRGYRNLDEIYAGQYDGLTEKEIKERDPQILADRKKDKLGFRYPRGESYYDMIARLHEVALHLERIREPILLVSHQAMLRLVYGWLSNVSREGCVDLPIPQHCVIKISYDGLGSARKEERFPLGPGKNFYDGRTIL